MASPSPTLNALISGDNILTAEWINNPYIDINNAYLLVANITTPGPMTYIYLTDDEALSGNYSIPNLINGQTYAVSYTQVQETPSGNYGMSNTLTGTPCTIPLPPILAGVVYQSSTTATAVVTITHPGSSGCIIEQVVFHICDLTDGPTFTNVSLPYTSDDTYTVTGLSDMHEYTIAVSSINTAGYSMLSNTVEYVQTVVPAGPPILGIPTFTASGSNTVVSFTINNNNSSIINSGVMLFVVPASGSAEPVHILSPSEIAAVNATPGVNVTVTKTLLYSVVTPSSAVPYLISASNTEGSTYENANLS